MRGDVDGAERDRGGQEPKGITYAHRVRPKVHRHADTGNTRYEGILTELFGPLASRVCGGGPPNSYLHLLFSLLFLRRCAPSLWAEVREDVRSALDAQNHPRQLLRVIGHHADKALQERGLPLGTSATFEGLGGEAIDDLAHVVRLCDELSPDAFRSLLDRFEAWTRSDGGAFFTPRSVVDLAVKMLAGDLRGPARVHDPYVRGGELLAGLSETGGRFVVSGAGPSGDTLRLAGMNLALVGERAHLSTGSAVPWSRPVGSQVELILTNPPFNNRTSSRPRPQDEDWAFEPPPAHNDNYAWLQHVLASLEPGGRACVLMPNRAAVTTDAKERYIRQRMIEEGRVEFIVALPRQIFAATAVPAMLWGLRSPVGSCDRVLFIDVRDAGSKSGKQRVLSPAELGAVADCLHGWRAGDEDYADAMNGVGRVVAASMAEIKKQDHSLDPADYLTDQLPVHGHEAGVSTPRPTTVLAGWTEKTRQADEKIAGIIVEQRPSSGDGLPRGWRRTRLHELCEIQAGPSHSLIKKAERAADDPDGVPLVVPRHLRDRRIVADKPERLSRKSADGMERFLLQKDDVLFVRTGSVGPVALVTVDEEGWLPGTNLMRLRSLGDVDPGYLLVLLSARSTQTWIKARTASATAIPSISAKTLGNLPVSLPPPDEQRRVGTLLSTLDAQISAHRALADAAEAMRAALANDLVSGLLAIGRSQEEPS